MFEVWLIVLALLMPAPPPPPSPATSGPVDFARDVRPILEKRCQPCHFPGGKMYAALPFDRPATIDKLGTRLFTRIKKDEEQKVIRAFLGRK